MSRLLIPVLTVLVLVTCANSMDLCSFLNFINSLCKTKYDTVAATGVAYFQCIEKYAGLTSDTVKSLLACVNGKSLDSLQQDLASYCGTGGINTLSDINIQCLIDANGYGILTGVTDTQIQAVHDNCSPDIPIPKCSTQ